jgi:hypothetical protein
MRLRPAFALLPFALAVTALATTSSVSPTDDPQPLKVTAEIIGQKYCPTNDTEYTIIFKLRMRFENQTNRKLIVDKSVGTGIFDIQIAADSKSFSDGEYEYSPIKEREGFFVGPDGKEVKEQLDFPGPNFTILAPGESFQVENDFNADGIGPLYGFPARRGALQPGNHVLGIWLSVWAYHANPEEVRKKWEPFGYLVYKGVLAGPIPFNLPAVQKIERCPPQ